MQNDAVFFEPSQVVLLAVVSTAFILWAMKRSRAVACRPLILAGMGDVLQKAIFSSNERPSPPFNQRSGQVTPRGIRRSRLSVAGDWLVPVIVWFLVIMMTMAIIGFLLGDR